MYNMDCCTADVSHRFTVTTEILLIFIVVFGQLDLWRFFDKKHNFIVLIVTSFNIFKIPRYEYAVL